MATDARFKDPFLNDAFDFSRYPVFNNTRNAQLGTIPYEPMHRDRRLSLYTPSSRGSPFRARACWRSRNVSEPLLMSSTKHLRETWFTNFASSRTISDITNLSRDDEISKPVDSSQSTTAICDMPSPDSGSGVDDNYHHLQKSPWTVSVDSCETTGVVEPSDHQSEGDSLYSMDSADQDAHRFLLSMPLIPKIKLERKATVRKPEPVPLSNAPQNQFLLSPRIRDLRTPARVSSRCYGRLLAKPSPQEHVSNGTLPKSHSNCASALHAFRRSVRWSDPVGKEAYTRSASEPVLGSSYESDSDKEPLLKKEIDESVHSDVLLSMIEDGSIDETPMKNGLSKRPNCHVRSSLRHSISFSSIVHAVTEGYASLDLFLRKLKAKSTTIDKSEEPLNQDEPTSKWAPKGDQIVIKVFVPSTDDIWKFCVPQDISLTDFSSRVVSKLGFAVCFSGSLWDEPRYYFRTDERFKEWVKGRVRFGRNLPIVAHVLPPPPLVKLSVDAGGCEVWCCA